ncbi:MAG: sugar phosphate isomerase/epimerase [Pirellulaceae bacterium]|jgi:sugar phosphate isomerase/epimerase|nr:sugar phosphate isomerase/epimerase [Thermoguttaceae bacterium]MDI9442738.1 sugar phosphate isomerase/epimerase family protein [Planctomycetota bacterium]NLY99662.1 sugar phosphate isomerase/epimerase [Pirellulaceae bacterium]
MTDRLSRRDFVAATGALAGATILAAGAPAGAPAATAPSQRFILGLNTGTILGHHLSAPEQVDVAAKAGYRAIEPWTGDLKKYVDGGGSLKDLRKRIDDAGLLVSSAIDFSPWAVAERAARARGIEQMKHAMGMLAELGGRHIAAAPAGIHRTPGIDLLDVARRYREILEIGASIGVIPQLEIWGGAETLGRAGEAALVAMQTGHPKACLLLDAYHMYKGGSPFEGLRLLNGAAMVNFHINDYPADPPVDQINDSHRVYPGDGVCPLADVLRALHETGFRGVLSLELFNKTYWEQYDALTNARLGLEKTTAVLEKAFG